MSTAGARSKAAAQGLVEAALRGELTRHLGAWFGVVAPLVGRIFNSPEMGAWPTLMAATARDVRGGYYFGPNKRFETAGPARRAFANARSRDPELARRLWEASIEMTGVDPGI